MFIKPTETCLPAPAWEREGFPRRAVSSSGRCGSVGVRGDDLTADRLDRARQVITCDRVLEELDAAVAHQRVDAAGVVAPGGIVRVPALPVVPVQGGFVMYG